MLIRKNFIAISGGPGTGKTTLLGMLAMDGFTIVGESGREIIKQRLANNLPPRPSPAEFAREMFDIDVKKYMDHRQQHTLVFFDRTFLDSAALLYDADPHAFESVKPIIDTHRFYQNVFFAPPWKEIYANDEERDQTFAEAERTNEMLSAWYEKNGYKVIQLPKTDVATRMAFVFDNLK